MKRTLEVTSSTGCPEFQQHIVMLAYGELDDPATHSLEQHLLSCAACRRELEAVRSLAGAMSLLPVEEPTPSLLARSRIGLEEALDTAPGRSWLERIRHSLGMELHVLQSARAAAAAVLLAGVVLGGYGGFTLGRQKTDRSTSVEPQAQTPIVAGVSKVETLPASGQIRVHFDQLSPASRVGSPNDPSIRSLLVAGAEDQTNPAVQQEAVNLLAADCQNGRECGENGAARNALMVALRYDNNPGVRRIALGGLQPYISEDTHVRDAVLESVLQDRDSDVRTAAIDMLSPVGTDSSVQQVLSTVAARDENPRIRTSSRAVLQRASEVQ